MFDEDEHILRRLYTLHRLTNIDAESMDSALYYEKVEKPRVHSSFRNLEFNYNFATNTDPYLWSKEGPPEVSTPKEEPIKFPVEETVPPKQVFTGKKAGKLYYCTVTGCSKRYTSSFGLKYHVKRGHSEDKMNVYKPYACKVENCGRTYKNNNGLKYHMKHFHRFAD